jgi:hypothetical protein
MMKRISRERLHSIGRALRRRALDDTGLAFTTIMLVVGVTSVALGAWGTGEAVNNKMTTDQAAEGLEQQAQQILDRTEGDDSPAAQDLRKNADTMQQAAGAMRSEANWDVTKNAVTLAVDTVTLPVNATTKLGKAAKFGWDFYSGTQLGQNAMNAVQDPGPDTSQSMQILQQAQFDKGGPTATDGSQPDYSANDPVDGFIFQTKTKVMNGEVSSMYPDADPTYVDDLSTSLVLDASIDDLSSPETEVSLQPGNPFTWDAVSGMTAKIDPANPSTGEMGQVQLTPEDQQALENGEKTQVVGQYYGTDGLEPVIVTGDPNSGLQTEFPLLPDQPVVNTDTNYKPDIDEMPDWWDGTVDSCPYLYVWDGGASGVPFTQNIKYFEMPLAGFLGFGPFALEYRAMYQFCRIFLKRGEEAPSGEA